MSYEYQEKTEYERAVSMGAKPVFAPTPQNHRDNAPVMWRTQRVI